MEVSEGSLELVAVLLSVGVGDLDMEGVGGGLGVTAAVLDGDSPSVLELVADLLAAFVDVLDGLAGPFFVTLAVRLLLAAAAAVLELDGLLASEEQEPDDLLTADLASLRLIPSGGRPSSSGQVKPVLAGRGRKQRCTIRRAGR